MLFNVNGDKLCIDGKETTLTKAQMKELGLIKPSTFDEVETGKFFYYVNACGLVRLAEAGKNYPADKELLKIGNYNTNERLMDQRALHETLDRLLWKCSIEKGYNPYPQSDNDRIYYIRESYDDDEDEWEYVAAATTYKDKPFNTVYFKSEEDAEYAITKIVIPFLLKHSDFEW